MKKYLGAAAPAIALALALSATACGDDDSTGPDVYSEPYAVQIWSTEIGIELATGTRALTNSTLFVPSGGREELEFVFLNEDSSPITPLSGEFLEIQIDNQTISTFTPDQAGAFKGTLRGLAPGTTGLVVRYMYGGLSNANAKASFVSAKFTLTVQ